MHPSRGQRLQQLPSPTEQQLQQRESGWNDRFFYEQPINSNKLPRPDRITANSPKPPAAAAQHKREKKIRDERLQYGNNEVKRKVKESKQPTNGRLMPLGFFPEPSTEGKLHSTKEGKLRLKALKAIDTRESLLYQLNALILCTPVQEALFQPSRPIDPSSSSSHGFQRMRAKAGMALAPTPSSRSSTSGLMTNAREATKMAQKLAEDLQLAGIQCVEAIVEWMLEAGAKAEKPPPFVWRERNYFLKMHHDLDFAQPELEARGIHLECYTQGNPLLIRPNQKLGRVLAAQAIVTEMVDLATTARKPSHELVDHGFERRVDDSHNPSIQQSEKYVLEPEDQELRLKPSSSVKIVSSAQQQESADMMILQVAENEEGGNSESEQNEAEHDDRQDDEYESELDEHEIKPPISKGHGLDASFAEELVNILDESLSDWVTPNSIAPASEVESGLTVLTAREDERLTSEYDNSFEDEAGEQDEAKELGQEEREAENQSSHDMTEQTMAVISASECNEDDKEPAALDDKEPVAPEDGEPGSNEEEESTSALEKDNQSPELDEANRIEAKDSAVTFSSEKSESEKLYESLLAELRRLSEAEDVGAIDVQIAHVAECMSWEGGGEIMAALANRESLGPVLEGSFFSVLAQFQLLPLTKPTEELLQSQLANETQLTSSIWRECLCIADSMYEFLASQIQLALENGNSLISEIEIDEAIELTEGVFTEISRATWLHLRTAVEFLKLIHSLHLSDVGGKKRCGSSGVSNITKLFYPYLVNLPREKLSSSWRQIAQLFESISPNLNDLTFLMDPTCKTLLLAASAGGSQTDGSESEREPMAFPKLTVVCERGNILETSVAALWTKAFAKSSPQPQFVLYPFFQSPFGEKIVGGLRVEEGEGKGPLKEWITLVSSEMAAKWKDVPINVSFHDNASVEANGNRLTMSSFIQNLRPGYEISWRVTDEERVTRIVNKIVDQDTVLLDRGVSTQSFPIAELKVRQPRQAFLEYMKASESFWLSAQTPDSPENHRILHFYGWYLASAVSHYSKIDLQLHPLFFCLLLDEKYRVTLEDVNSLDSTLYDSLIQMKTISQAEFAAFLELEGGDSSLSVEKYILQVVDEKFGTKSNIWWQFEELRAGFRRVFSQDELNAAGIGAEDLAEVLCGSAQGAVDQNADFTINEIFRVALDPDFIKCLPLRRVFWRVVDAFDPQVKRKFVKFVTGVDTLPLPGTEFLRIEMPFAALTPAENQKILQMLPQSHTCDNTLELPNYWRALCWKSQHDEHQESETLEEELTGLLTKKLRDAVEYSSGYGLDGTSAITGILSEKSGKRPGSSTSRSEFAKDESYDSLDLPGIGDDGESSVGHIARAQPPSLPVVDVALSSSLSPLPQGRQKLTDPEELSLHEEGSEPDRPASTPLPPETAVAGEETTGSETIPPLSSSSSSFPSARSLSKSARQRNDPEESYGENDWEEEEELLD